MGYGIQPRNQLPIEKGIHLSRVLSGTNRPAGVLPRSRACKHLCSTAITLRAKKLGTVLIYSTSQLRSTSQSCWLPTVGGPFPPLGESGLCLAQSVAKRLGGFSSSKSVCRTTSWLALLLGWRRARSGSSRLGLLWQRAK